MAATIDTTNLAGDVGRDFGGLTAMRGALAEARDEQALRRVCH